MQLASGPSLLVTGWAFLIHPFALCSSEFDKRCIQFQLNIPSPLHSTDHLLKLNLFCGSLAWEPAKGIVGLQINHHQGIAQVAFSTNCSNSKMNDLSMLLSYSTQHVVWAQSSIHTGVSLSYQSVHLASSRSINLEVGSSIFFKFNAVSLNMSHTRLWFDRVDDKSSFESASDDTSKSKVHVLPSKVSSSKPEALRFLFNYPVLNCSNRLDQPHTKLWIIDREYLEDFQYKLQSLPINESVILRFASPRYLINRLQSVERIPDSFLRMQLKYFYTRFTLFDRDQLLKELNNFDFLENRSTGKYTLLHARKKFHKNFLEKELKHIRLRGLPKRTHSYYVAKPPKAEILNLYNTPPLILNLGSGDDRLKKLPGFNLDASPVGEPDFCLDARDLSPILDKQFTLVRASHILEHFYPAEVINVLRNWSKVLHPNGELHLAVPDARVTFGELESGKTSKGSPAYSLLHTTAPLAQIYGVGYESKNTDPRWRHRILFNQPLLEKMLYEAGYNEISLLPKACELALNCGVVDDAQNHYTLLIRAKKKQSPHRAPVLIAPVELRRKIEAFKSEFGEKSISTPLSILVPVSNEAPGLLRFLHTLEGLIRQRILKYPVECILIVNNSTDQSDVIIQSFLADHPQFPGRLEYSEPSILKAFIHGVAVRRYDGYVAKIDADTRPGYGALDLMYMFLHKQPLVRATYADPVPIVESDEMALLEHYPELRSERLYLHGRCSMYSGNPLLGIHLPALLSAGCLVEDVALSYAFIAHLGFESIARTPHAVTYHRPVETLEELEIKLNRTRSEIKRLEERFPYLSTITPLLRRTLNVKKLETMQAPGAQSIVTTYERAHAPGQEAPQFSDWTHLPSTKLLHGSYGFKQI